MSDKQEAAPVATGKDVTIHAMQLTAWNGALPTPVFVGATVVNLAATFIGRKSK